jgi:hypothetical protein
MYRKIVYFLVVTFTFSFVHTFFSGCRLVDGQDPGLDALNSNSSLLFNSLVLEANCLSETNVGESFSCQPKAIVNSEKIDSNQIIWELSQLNTCQWINLNPVNGYLNGTSSVSQIGSCVLSFRVKSKAIVDPENKEQLPEEIYSELSLPINVKPPIINSEFKNCVNLAGVDEAFQCDISASNAIVASTFTYELSASNRCSWVQIDGKSGHMSGTPKTNHIGSCNLAVLIRDNFGSSIVKEISLTIPAVSVKITPTSCPNTGKVNTSYSCELLGNVNLPDKSLVWSLGTDNTCVWASINSVSGIITGSPPIQFSDKICNLSVRASSKNGEAQGAVLLPVQIAKVVFSISEVSCSSTVNVNGNSICSLKATTDIASPQITWSKELDNTCSFISVNANSADISMNPTIDNVGNCKFSIAATLNSSIKILFNKNINVPTVPISINMNNCAASLNSNISYSCTLAATSTPYIASASFKWTTTGSHTCSWLSINPDSGILTGTPSIDNVGSCTIGVSAKLGNASEGVSTKVITTAVRMYAFNTLSDLPLTAYSAGGTAVSTDNSYVVVGAPGFAQGNGSTGTVLIYQRDAGQNALTLKQIINPPDTKIKGFGYSVSIKGSVLVVGAPLSTNTLPSQGVSLIYEMSGSTWIQTGIIWGSSSSVNGYFGASVSTDGSKILIGSGHFNYAAAFLVQKSTNWTITSSLDFPAINSSNGPDRIKVALNGNQAAISDRFGGAAHSGEVHVFDYVTSSYVKKPVPLTGAASESFGASIAFFKNWLLIGAPLGNGGLGQAYLYEKDGNTNYSLKSLITSPFAKANDNCGASVAIYERALDRILLGCPTSGSGPGSVYAYFLNPGTGTFSLESKIVNPNGKTNDQFGSSVSGSSGLVSIGAKLFDLPTYTDSGSVFTYSEL